MNESSLRQLCESRKFLQGHYFQDIKAMILADAIFNSGQVQINCTIYLIEIGSSIAKFYPEIPRNYNSP